MRLDPDVRLDPDAADGCNFKFAPPHGHTGDALRRRMSVTSRCGRRVAACSLAVTRHLVVTVLLTIPGASSFVLPSDVRVRRYSARPAGQPTLQCRWSPQDLTEDCPGFLPIPDDDYVKKYQRNPELWPVELFLIAYRRTRNEQTQERETQLLVRASANGTSKWGVGTGVPATRWILSTQEKPPRGYRWSEVPGTAQQQPRRISFEARSFPEFRRDGQQSWTYDKIDICEDAFNGPDAAEFKDPELEAYAIEVRNGLRTALSEALAFSVCQLAELNSWEATRASVVKNVLDKANSLAAVQGTLRMSGLFARKSTGASADATSVPRYVSLGKDAPDPVKLVRSMRVYTMFPQMPDPMPLPSTPPEELQEEIKSRAARMAASGRDPHQDPHGRRFTHISTSNPSNTIHGVYLTLDATGLPGLDEVPALDLFGTKEVKREWKSLQDLNVLDSDGRTISTVDTKPTFISGFIVRQLVAEGVIDIDGPSPSET